MEFENRKERVKRIIKNIMHALDFQSVQSFADAIGVNYMQVYYAYNGTISNISPNVIDAIMRTFPEVNKLYLMEGEGEILNKSESAFTFATEESKPVTNEEMFHLLDRITILLEKIQEREEYIIQREKMLDEMIAKLDEKLSSKK